LMHRALSQDDGENGEYEYMYAFLHV